MKRCLQLLALTMIGLLVVACSSTSMSGSWSSDEYKGQIRNVYVIGLAKSKVNQRIFEDTFVRQLSAAGVNAIASYSDFPADKKMDKETIKQQMLENGSDSVLLTKLIGQRTELVTSPGSYSGYSSRPYYGGRGGWGGYSRSYDVVYRPPTTTEFVVLTVESVLYDLKTEAMIWSAQLETVVEGNLEKMMQDYVETVDKDLKKNGLI
ncbi:MAG: hypothetical protein DRH08_05350 [Deltaproteobacteria bacterium]|nr:MAG: hypothetical protein DRH08_05350 [Deltaproteobacteria bacterium]